MMLCVYCLAGGKVDMFHVSPENAISGIFIKHVLENSPAGRNGTLKTGDRILQVRQGLRLVCTPRP